MDVLPWFANPATARPELAVQRPHQKVRELLHEYENMNVENTSFLRTDFRALFQDNNPNFVSLLPLELLQPNSSTQTSRTTTDDTDVDLILRALDRLGIERLVPARS